MYAPIRYSEPCARLTLRISPNTSENPLATRKYSAASVRPLRKVRRKSFKLRPPRQAFSSPLVGEGCGALANAVSLGGAGWGVTRHDRREGRTNQMRGLRESLA